MLLIRVLIYYKFIVILSVEEIQQQEAEQLKKQLFMIKYYDTLRKMKEAEHQKYLNERLLWEVFVDRILG
jgi:hypothetical protein